MDSWKLNFDGSCSKTLGSGAGVILEGPTGRRETYHQFLGKGLTCNQSEYAALITGMEIARKKNITRITALGDSKLICEQVSGNWEVKSTNLIPYFEAVNNLKVGFEFFEIVHIPREENHSANLAARIS